MEAQPIGEEDCNLLFKDRQTVGPKSKHSAGFASMLGETLSTVCLRFVTWYITDMNGDHMRTN